MIAPSCSVMRELARRPARRSVLQIQLGVDVERRAPSEAVSLARVEE